VHTASSAPDVAFAVSSLFLKRDEKINLAELEYQYSSKFGTGAEFRCRHRAIGDKDFETTTSLFFPGNANRGACALVAGTLPIGCTANADGSCTFLQTSNTARK